MKQNLRPLLELESGSNDPMAYMITIVMIQLLSAPEISGWLVVVQFLQQLLFGAGAGYLLGKFAVKLINGINLDNDALYSVLMLTIMFFIYGLTTQLGGNGYLAVYLGGLIIGNHKVVHRRSTTKFFDGITWLMQIIMFLTLGLLVEPRELLPVAGIGIIVGLFMILVSRPLSVFLSLLPFKNLTFNARLFTSWVGLRGAVPIIFATYPMVNDVPQAKMIFNIVFFITILSLMVQGTTVSLLANWLNLSKILPSRPKLKEFDVEFSDDIKSATCEITVNKEMLKQGHNLLNINLPEHTLVVMVKRDNRYFIPRGNTHLEEGDSLLVITDNEEAMRETYRQLGITPLE